MYTILPSAKFAASYKRLKKKYKSLDDDIKPFVERLKVGDFSPDNMVQGFETSIYKARVASRDQGRGKRGGFRVVYYVVTPKGQVRLLSIYAKTQQENISPQEIKRLLKDFRN